MLYHAVLEAQALDALAVRAEAHFGQKEPSDAELAAFLSAVPTWELHAMTREDFLDMPSVWRLEQGHLHHPPTTTAHPRRPTKRDLTAEELASIEGLPWDLRHTRGREMQQTPLEPRPDGA